MEYYTALKDTLEEKGFLPTKKQYIFSITSFFAAGITFALIVSILGGLLG